MSGPTPVVLCGASSQIATEVKNGLLPEIEIIHVVLSAEAGAAEIPLFLEGKSLPSSNNVGSQNYSQKPAAVVTGGGNDDARFELMKDACEGMGIVSWLRPLMR
ncbi:hypothetical protein BGZ57DRAFT_879854 [Hyaloscypha finlandica]|nr:hypothetical protein BGZ57DRAFT_879854 [Hyaloscypha finlandica]